jgi:hypothetical protein
MNLSSIKPNFSSTNTANTLVLRDASGGITAGTVTASTLAGKLAPTVFSSETALTDVATDDLVLVYDSSTQTTKKVTVDNLMRRINNVPYLEYVWAPSPSTNAQTIPHNTWTTLNLTTKLFDTANLGPAPSGNQVNLPAGTYEFEAKAIIYYPQEGLGYFRLTAGATVVESSQNHYNYGHYNRDANLSGQFVLSSAANCSLSMRNYNHDGVSMDIKESYNRSYIGRINDPNTSDSSKRVVLKLWKIA